jgi:hypothetical protein
VITVELEVFCAPSIEVPLQEVERWHQSDNATSGIFAVLDACEEPHADGKLHLLTHVSTEKSGVDQLGFSRTVEVLWKTRNAPRTHPPSSVCAARSPLLIMLDDGNLKPCLLHGMTEFPFIVPDVPLWRPRLHRRDGLEPSKYYFGSLAVTDVRAFCSACWPVGVVVTVSIWLISAIRWLICSDDQFCAGEVLPKIWLPYWM